MGDVASKMKSRKCIEDILRIPKLVSREDKPLLIASHIIRNVSTATGRIDWSNFGESKFFVCVYFAGVFGLRELSDEQTICVLRKVRCVV